MISNQTCPVALIVCTRNRVGEITGLLGCLQEMAIVPNRIIVVDSSERLMANEVRALCESASNLEVTYIHSLYGAPHQKNVGLDHLAKLDFAETELVAFLDDDIVPNEKYFEKLISLFKGNSEVFCFGGFDRKLTRPKVTKLRQALGLDSEKINVLLPNALSVAHIPLEEVVICDWVPGGMQNFRVEAVEENRFDGTIRIHGDEVEFQLRLQSKGFGKIATSSLLAVDHMAAQSGKTNFRSSTGYLDGFRWRLAKEYPKRFSKAAVVRSTILLAMGEALLWASRGRKSGLFAFMGHVDFLVRVLLGKETLERVSHAGSGPYTKAKND